MMIHGLAILILLDSFLDCYTQKNGSNKILQNVGKYWGPPFDTA